MLHNYCPYVSKFTPFRSTTSPFPDTGHFETSARMSPSWPWTLYKVKCTPYMCYQYPLVPYFTPFCSTTSRFWVTGHFKTNVPNNLKMTLNTARWKVHHICVTSDPESQISVRLAVWPAVFEISALNDPKLTLNTARLHVPHTCVTSIHESYISLCVTLRPAVFALQAILRQVHRMTPNWRRTLQSQINLYMHKYCFRVLNFTPFRSMTSRFRATGHIETSKPNGPKLTLNTTGSYVPHICVTSIHECQISLRFVLRPVVSMIRTFYNSRSTPM